MKVKELIAALKKMPPEAEVIGYSDREVEAGTDLVYVGKQGDVILTYHGMNVTHDFARPKDAPSVKEEMHWSTPKKS